MSSEHASPLGHGENLLLCAKRREGDGERERTVSAIEVKAARDEARKHKPYVP